MEMDSKKISRIITTYAKGSNTFCSGVDTGERRKVEII